MINFQNATILNLSQQNVFFEGVARYKTVQSLQIEGFVLALNNTSGVQPIYSGMSGLIGGATDYDAIVLNSINFGSGRVTSFNFGQSSDNDVQTKPYTASIEIYGSGDLASLNGGYYSGLNFSGYDRINQIEENFSYQNSDGKHNYSHNVSLQLLSGADDQNPISIAKIIASNLFTHTNLSGLVSQFTPNYRKFYTENYNLQTNQCSWTENVEFGEASGNYSIEFNHEIRTDERGITTATEKGNIKGLVNPIYSKALAGLNAQKPYIYPRVSGVYSNYVGGGGTLFNIPLVKQHSLNKFAGTIDYSYTFTNDPKYTGTFIWEYTHELDKNGNIYNVSENGSVEGIGRKNDDKFTKAEAGYNTIIANIETRINDFYQDETSLSNTLYRTQSSVSKSVFDGKITYGRTYTDDATLLAGEIKKADLEINDSQPVYMTNKFNIVGQKEVIQPTDNIATIGKRSITLNTIGGRNTTMSTFLTDAKTRISPHTGFLNDSFIESINYSLSRKTNAFNLTMSIAGIENPTNTFGDVDL